MTHSASRRAVRDIANDASTTAKLNVGESYVGRFEKQGDSDWVAVKLVAGVTYTFNLGPGAANADIPFDTTLGIYNASGTLLAFNDDVGETYIYNPGTGGVANPWNTYSFIEFTAATTGTYYLAASTLDNGGGSAIGDYVLSAFAGDLPGDMSSPAMLEVGGASVTSRLDQSGDTDGFGVATVAGEYYTASVTWSGGDYDHFVLPLIEARGADGVVINTTTNGGVLTTQLTFQASSSSTWLDVASEFPGYDIGQYSIHIEEASPVDAIEQPWWPLLPADVKVYFAEDVNVTNVLGDSYFAPAWADAEMNAASRAFQQYSDVANVSFTVVDDPAEADLVMLNRQDDQYAGQWLIRNDITIDGIIYNASTLEIFVGFPGVIEGAFEPGTFGYQILIHELGHAMGLGHPHPDFDYSASIPGIFWANEYGDFALGQNVYTQMAYKAGFSEKDGFLLALNIAGAVTSGTTNESFEFGAAFTPMAIDIAALQLIYGANITTRTGNDTYVLPDENGVGTGYVAIWDNGGIDTIAASATNTEGVTIDLRPASLDYDKIGGGAVSWARDVQGGFTIANGVVVENAIGAAGNDRLVGNAAANRLEGLDGNDELGGGAGDDLLLGGDGNDRLFGDALPGKPSGIGFGSGLIISGAGADNNEFDTAWDITNAFALFSDPNVANSQTIPHVTIEGTGDGSIDFFKITLEKGATLTIDMDSTTGGFDGGVGIYSSDFSWLALFDDGLMSAGAGGSFSQSDSYGSFTAWDGGTYYIAVRDANFPDVAVGQSYELHVSVAAMTDTIGTGAGNDYLDGGFGDDYLDGGFGRDTMIGGFGDDVFVVDNYRDVVIEKRGGGEDTILSSVSLNVNGFAKYVENLTLTGTADLFGFGNALDNTITGNDGANRLKGEGGDDRLFGGAGNDRLEGGSGNDWLDGGLGNDRLLGGSGDDMFYFGGLLGSGNVDTIMDFNRHHDLILLDADIFVGLSLGSLQSSMFNLLSWGSDVDSSDRILYNQRTGALYFDQDGSGASYDAIHFANVTINTSLSADDFLIV